MRLLLAPMEGVVDHHVRELYSSLGGIDICVTEFLRVTNHLLPDRSFKRICPELIHNSLTTSGTPVRLQLLGSNPEALADNAKKAAQMGASTIDLNFGCPAKTVNSSDGGALLLKTPERLYNIIKAVRDAVPITTPVTAKIRLGFEDKSLYLENSLAAYEAGANELVVHARSKVDGYRPPAYWHYLADIKSAISIPVIANGEIWTVADWQQCKEESGCDDFMLGRGALSCPDLALQIKAASKGVEYTPLNWVEVCKKVFDYYKETKDIYPEKFLGNRIKQWLSYLRRQYPEADIMFETIKRMRTAEAIEYEFNNILMTHKHDV
jgi:tRNA-dihydrouridine synthase C